MKSLSGKQRSWWVAPLVALAAIVGLATVSASDQDSAGVVSIFRVEGMTCVGCEAAVKTKVGRLEGVERVVASHKEKRAEVTHDPGKVSTERIAAAIEELGYKAELLETRPAGQPAEEGSSSSITASAREGQR